MIKGIIKLGLMLALLTTVSFAGQAGFVQSTNNSVSSTTATSLATTMTQATSAGDLNCVGVALDGANALTVTVSSVTDGGDTYSKVVSKTQSGGINEDMELWCASNIAAGKTAFTVNISGALGTNGGIQVMQVEYAGVDTGSVATITNNTASSSSASSTNATLSITPAANGLVVAMVNCSPVTAGSASFRLRQNPGPGNGFEDRLNGISGTAYNPAFTIASADNYAMVAASFTVTTGLTIGVADIQHSSFSGGGAGSTTSVSFNRVEAGDGFVSALLLAINTDTQTSVKDSGSNTFTVSAHSPAALASAGAVYVSYYGNELTAGAQTITATFTSSNAGAFYVYEIFGEDIASHSSMFDIDNKDTATNAVSTTAPSITTTNTDLLIAASFACNTITGTSNGWIPADGVVNNGLSIFKNSQAAGTYNANFTQNTSGCWATVLAGFKAATAGAVNKMPPRVM